MKQAAEALGVTTRRVVALIADGKIQAERVGPIWIIKTPLEVKRSTHGPKARWVVQQEREA